MVNVIVSKVEKIFKDSLDSIPLVFPRDGTSRDKPGRDIPLSRDKKKILSRCPVVPGQGQEQMSQDKLLCPGPSRDKTI